MKQYYYKEHAEASPKGPFSESKMERLRSKGIVTPEMLVTVQQDGDWKPVADEKSLRPYPKNRYGAILLLLAVNWLVYFFVSDRSPQDQEQTLNGMASYWACMEDHEWWRCLTGLFVAPDLGILIFSSLSLLLLGVMVAPVMGFSGFLLFYILCGLISTILCLPLASYPASSDGIFSWMLASLFLEFPIPGMLASSCGIASAAIILCSHRRRFGINAGTWSALMLVGAAAFFALSFSQNVFLFITLFGAIVGGFLALPSFIKYNMFLRRESGQTEFRISMRDQWHLSFTVIALLGIATASYLISGDKGGLASYKTAWQYGWTNGDTDNSPQAAEAMLTAAKRGYPAACEAVGYRYLKGLDYPPNRKEAVKWFTLAAESGYPRSQYELANAFKEGRGTQASDKQALAWLRKSADAGYGPAVQALAVSYLNGSLGIHDPAKGAALLEQCMAGMRLFEPAKEAAYILGTLYARGEGVGKDPAKAFELYTKAAEQGMADAQWKLALCYKTGEGVASDPVKSIQWMQKAAAQDQPDAIRTLHALRKMLPFSEDTPEADAPKESRPSPAPQD